MTLSASISRIFGRAHRAFGSPTMQVARPVSQWTLPAGYSYDATTDTLKDGAGAVVRSYTSYIVYDTVNFLPAGTGRDQRALVAAGIVPAGETVIYTLPADVTTLRAAYGVVLDGQWYDVAEVAQGPAGQGATGAYAAVTLRRRS